MTSQIRVDEITNRSGLGTVTIYDNGFEFTGVTTFKEDVDITGGLTIGGVLTYEDTTNIDSVGLITARAGIRVTGDSIHVESSEDRLLYLKSTDANAYLTFEDTDSSSAFANRVGTVSDGLYFSTGGGGERVRIDSAGRLLIGRTSQLQSSSERFTVDSGMGIIRNNSTSTGALYLRNEDSTADTRHPYLIFTDGSGNRGGIGIQNDSSSLWISGQNGIAFRTGGSAPSTSERLRITSGGLVGIDVTSPATNLDVNGTLQLRASGNTTYATRIYSRLDSTHCTVIESYLNNSTAFEMMGSYADGGGSNPRVVISAGGQKVGINETAPDRTLHVNSGATDTALKLESTDTEVSLELTDNTGSSYIGGGGSYLNFYSGGNERARITGIGSVGIGENDPQVLLHLKETNADPYNTVITHLKLDNAGGNGGSGSRIELKTGAARCWIQSFIEGGNSGSGGALVFGTPSSGTLGTERLRITSGGDVLVGGQSAYTYDDTGASNTILDIWNSGNNKRGILSLSGNTNGGSSIGTIWFNNDNNSGASPGNNMKLSAAIQSQAVTSDSNAGNDAGGTLQFLTKPEGSPMVESMRITSIGDIYQRNQRVHTCLHAEYRQLNSGSVNTDSVGSWVDIRNFGYTPKRSGSLIVCHFQVQTWNGSSSNMNGDIYFRARYDQGTGTYVTVNYGGNNNRATGNLDQDSNRQHLFYTHKFGFIAQNTNQHTINLQASNGSSLSTDFNWFHTTDNSNGCWIFEYDN